MIPQRDSMKYILDNSVLSSSTVKTKGVLKATFALYKCTQSISKDKKKNTVFSATPSERLRKAIGKKIYRR